MPPKQQDQTYEDILYATWQQNHFPILQCIWTSLCSLQKSNKAYKGIQMYSLSKAGHHGRQWKTVRVDPPNAGN